MPPPRKQMRAFSSVCAATLINMQICSYRNVFQYCGVLRELFAATYRDYLLVFEVTKNEQRFDD